MDDISFVNDSVAAVDVLIICLVVVVPSFDVGAEDGVVAAVVIKCGIASNHTF